MSECVCVPVRVRAGAGKQLSVSESEGDTEEGSKGEGEEGLQEGCTTTPNSHRGGAGKEIKGSHA